MRILYIAPFRDFSGYATAARGYLRALHQAGADLVARPVRYDRADFGSEYQPTVLERELLSKPIENPDVIIQHLTPNEMRLPETVKDKRNIAVVAWETSHIPEYWAKKLNQFDAVITFCQTSKIAFQDSGVNASIHVVPHCFDIVGGNYDLDNIKPLWPEGAGDFLKDRFIFYNISQFSHKKGLDVLLRAYYRQFWNRAGQVALILKTYINMAGDRAKEQEQLAEWIKQIRAAMRLPSYPPIVLINQTMTEDQIKRLHALGDCYVCSSRGEGWNIPAFEAVAYGKKLVTTNWGGMGEFAVDKDGVALPNVFLVDYMLEPLVGQQHPDPDLYTARDLVAEPSVYQMGGAMLEAKDSPIQPKADLSAFDYSVVGPQMKEIISNV